MRPGRETQVPYSSDCDRCAGLCCVALAFDRGASFSFDKRADEPCPRLTDSYRCAHHEARPALGMSGCVTYSCFGAGPWVTEHLSACAEGPWSPRALALFRDLVPLHELGFLLSVAEGLPLPSREEAGRRAWLARIASLLDRAPSVSSPSDSRSSPSPAQIDRLSAGIRSFLRELGPYVRSRRHLPVLARRGE